jgi:uncharacterized protein (DUF2141 family)
MNVLQCLKTGFTMAVVSLCVVSIASASDQTQKRDRKKDGSCQIYIMEKNDGLVLAADQTRRRDRKRDKSCQSYTTEKNGRFVLAADQDRDRDRKRDKDCQG